MFEVTHDIKDLTCAALFNKVGNKAPLTIRFSTVGGELGSADTARDPRGAYLICWVRKELALNFVPMR